MLTEFPQAYADAFAAGLGVGFLACCWAFAWGRVMQWLRKLGRIGEDF